MKLLFTPKLRFLIISLNLLVISAFAQKQSVKGTIKDKVTGELLPGVTVLIENTQLAAQTDFDGNFELKNITEGTYNIVVKLISYKQFVIKNYTVNANSTPISVDLESDVKELTGFDVTATRVTNTEKAVMMEIKSAEQVVSGVSSQQIAKTQDRSASDVIKRVPGVSIIDGRFVMVRGLSERYNAVLLNGVLTPSSEADRKSFSFDIIPSGALDRLLIYKTGAPELPGEFAGGVIKVYTKNTSDNNSLSVGLSNSFRVGTTGNDFYYNQKYASDILGFGFKNRALPYGFPNSLNNVKDETKLEEFAKKLPNNWTSQVKTAAPDQRLNAMFTKTIKGSRITANNTSSINYSNTNESVEMKNYNYNAYDLVEKSSDTIYNYTDNRYTNQVRFGALHNWAFIIDSRNKIEFKNIFNQIASDQSILRTGENFEEGFDVQNFAYRYTNRTIYNGQLNGNHEFNGGNSTLNWATAFSKAWGKEPDFKRLRTVRNIGTEDAYKVIIAPGASTLDAGRFYSQLNEKVITASADYEQKISLKNSEIVPKLRTGFYVEKKDRDFSARWMSYGKSVRFNEAILEQPLEQLFSSENINATNGFTVKEGTNPSDSYTAANMLTAAYVGTSIPFSEKINLSGGVRIENNIQKLKSNSYTGKPIGVYNPIFRVLPSVNFAYNFNEKNLVRLAYAQTLNRPEFRELAPFSYYDFSTNTVLYGNNDLKTPTIHNLDARYEIYPSASEMISVGMFYKKFINPIEMFFVPGTGSGGTRNFTFGNAEQATSIGAELEVRKSLVNLSENKFIQNFSVVANASYIVSEVKLGASAVGQNPNRPMMGQSPYIINTGLYFDDADNKIQFNILYNVIGKRLYAVGTVGNPDIYEMPRNIVDLNVSKGFGKHFEVKLGIQDLFNQATSFIQDSDANGKLNGNDEQIMKYKVGQYVTLGVNYKL